MIMRRLRHTTSRHAPITTGHSPIGGCRTSQWRLPYQADDLYELITERAGRSLILTSNRAPADWYPLLPNPVVAESLPDRLINTSHQAFMNGPSYRPSKHPGRVTLAGKEDTAQH